MPRKKQGRKSITAIFTEEEYNTIQALASKKHTSMNAVVRDFVVQGLNGRVTEDNMEYIAPVIRAQIKSVLEPQMERLIALTAKSCIQSGAAAYLSADAIYKFVPSAQREEVEVSYEQAKKKSLIFMKSKVNMNE